MGARQKAGKNLLSEAGARVLCYAGGAVSAALMLQLRQYGHVWSIRFHAFHSILITAAWAAIWGALRGIEAVSPWFLATVAREARFAANLAFVILWVYLLVAAYRGGREVISVSLHNLAVRLARRTEGPAGEANL